MLDSATSSSSPSLPDAPAIDIPHTSRLALATLSRSRSPSPSSGSDHEPGSQSPLDNFENYEVDSETSLSGFEGRRLTVCRDQSGQRVVVKEGLSRPNEEILSCFCECDHPGILSFCEVIHRDHRDFALKELFENNGSFDTFFSSLLAGERPLFWFPTRITREALNIGFALLFLHSRGHFHGSLNPSHLLFDEDHHLRLDLSSSVHFRTAPCFERESFCHRYLSPEFLSGETNFSSDIYSFGVLLYELFTESTIYREGLTLSDFHNELKAGILPKLPDRVDVSIRDLIYGCLSYDCSSRPSIETVLFGLLKSGPEPFAPKCFREDECEALWKLALSLETVSRRQDGCGAIGSEFVSGVRRAADSGDRSAQNLFGFLVLRGLGCPENAELGFSYFERCGEGGDGSGMFHCGLCLREGKGIAKDSVRAVDYLRRSADLGHPGGLFEYGFYRGLGKYLRQPQAMGILKGFIISSCLFI
jgi:hypothetical protein